MLLGLVLGPPIPDGRIQLRVQEEKLIRRRPNCLVPAPLVLLAFLSHFLALFFVCGLGLFVVAFRICDVVVHTSLLRLYKLKTLVSRLLVEYALGVINAGIQLGLRDLAFAAVLSGLFFLGF